MADFRGDTSESDPIDFTESDPIDFIKQNPDLGS